MDGEARTVRMEPTIDDPHDGAEKTARLDRMAYAITQETADDIFNLTAYLCAADSVKEGWFGDDEHGFMRLVCGIRFDVKYAPILAALAPGGDAGEGDGNGA